MSRRAACAVLWAALLCPGLASAGSVLAFREEGIRKGKPWSSTVTTTSGEGGTRVEVSETADGTSSYMLFVYVKADATVHFIDVNSGKRVAIDKALLDALRGKLVKDGKPAKITPPVPVPLKTQHTVNGFPCEAWALRQKGRPDRFACLADPAALGIDAGTLANLRVMGDLLAPFMVYVKRLAGESDGADAFNSWALPGGFPVREWEPGKGSAIAHESQLLSVKAAKPSESLFQKPD